MSVNVKLVLFFSFLSFLLLSFSNVMAGKISRWVDNDGIIHFSNMDPGQVESQGLVREENLKRVQTVSSLAGTKNDKRFKTPVEHAIGSTFTIKGSRTLGTGFFISENGYAITCKHVVEDMDGHMAVLSDRSELPIGIISTSDLYDLALVLVITSLKTPHLTFRDPESMVPGERVLAIGSSVGFQSTITNGVFTGLRKKMPSEDKVIQFSARINPGNSGGPLIDESGHAIGVVSWKIVANKGVPVSGVGFAVPVEYLLEEYGRYLK